VKRIVIGATLSALAALLVGAPAVAAVPPRPAAGIESANHSGYVVAGQGGLHEMTAEWVQPQAECGSDPTYANIQLELAKKTAITKIGTAVECHHGKPVAYAWYTGFDRGRYRLPDRLLAGDHITVSVSWYHDEARVSISNETRHWGAGVGMADGFVQVPTRVSLGVAARVSEHGPLPLADFGIVEFSGASVDGQPISASTATPVTMVSGRTVQAKPGPIDPPGAFGVAWRHA